MPTDKSKEWVNSVMEQAQEFASAWSLVGGRFDDGSALEHAEKIKAKLRATLNASQLFVPAEPEGWIFEDDLSDEYPYDAMFPYSKISIVRVFPVFVPSTLSSEVLESLGLLEKVAMIAHEGGFVNLTQEDALTIIRKLTVNHKRSKNTIAETMAALAAVKKVEL